MMQFWGVEVKNGSTLKVQPGEAKVVHLSQACLGEVKKDKGNESIRLYVQKNSQKFVIGILSLEKFPHINFDLVFEDEFELSHDWKHGSVHFAGYKADNPDSILDEDESDDDEEPIPIEVMNNGKPETKEPKASGDKAGTSVKPQNAEGKPKVKIVEPAKKDEEDDETEDEDDDDDDDDDESDENEDEEDEDMQSAGGSDDEDESDEEEESDEETPKKSEPSKKRAAGSTSKTPVPDKKAKLATPQQKADGKKVSGHVATPHPAKQAAKTPGNTDKSNKQTPKSSGSVPCTSCGRSFGSEQALQSHSKAKHGAQ